MERNESTIAELESTIEGLQADIRRRDDTIEALCGKIRRMRAELANVHAVHGTTYQES